MFMVIVGAVPRSKHCAATSAGIFYDLLTRFQGRLHFFPSEYTEAQPRAVDGQQSKYRRCSLRTERDRNKQISSLLFLSVC